MPWTCSNLVGGEYSAHLDEGAHYGDVHFGCAIALENAGKHCDALLGEDMREIAAGAAPGG